VVGDVVPPDFIVAFKLRLDSLADELCRASGRTRMQKPYCYIVFVARLLAIGDVVLMHVAGDETKLGADARITARAIGS
jgi:hypothetical protein